MGLATSWPPADLVDALRAEMAKVMEMFVAGDVLGARHKLAEVGRMLSRQPPGKRGKARLITWAGRTQTLTAWARELGRTPQALSYRLAVMPFERAMTPRKKK